MNLNKSNIRSINKIDNIDEFIEENIPFIIKTASSFLGRYISVENDEEYSVALIAFNEAIERYHEDKGSFWSFARLVIESRLKNHLKKVAAKQGDSSLEEITESGVQIKNEVEVGKTSSDLKDEIIAFKKELLLFNITLEILVKESPKHKDTRIRAINLGRSISEDIPIVGKIYEKKRLPIKDISRKFDITEKIIKGSKTFILSTTVLFFKKYTNLITWIKGVK